MYYVREIIAVQCVTYSEKNPEMKVLEPMPFGCIASSEPSSHCEIIT